MAHFNAARNNAVSLERGAPMQSTYQSGRKAYALSRLISVTFLWACSPSVSSETSARPDDQSTQQLSKTMSGESFLANNRTRQGVVTTNSGLQYKVLVQGAGARPGPRDSVSTHYVGTLIDGTVFDSSRARGSAAQFPVNGVIRGWTEALQLMPVGSKWMLYVPPNLAYGSRGVGTIIGPDETLVFEVELLGIVGR